MSDELEQLAENRAGAIWYDLDDRPGFDTLGVDDNTRRDILESWKRFILSALKKTRKAAMEGCIRVVEEDQPVMPFTGPQRQAQVRIVQALRELAKGSPEDGSATAKSPRDEQGR